MFTGIVTDIGTLASLKQTPEQCRMEIATHYDTSGISLGASIACSGCCLTVVETAPHRFFVDVSAETLRCTTLGDWREGQRINLERALKVGDELGGHWVSGHVDGVASLVTIAPGANAWSLTLEAPSELARFIAPKGSITLDGVSLTVNSVETLRFSVNIIPHTRAVTTLGELKEGDRVNLEIDLLARYIARLQES